MALLTDIVLWRFSLPLDKPSRVTHHASARAAAVHSGFAVDLGALNCPDQRGRRLRQGSYPST
jgi:hypothetical protein